MDRRFQSENRRRLSGPGLRTFLAIADLWDLTDEQRRLVLGLPSRQRFRGWAAAAREHRDLILGVDVLTRISAVLGVHQALSILFATEREAVNWLTGPHRAPAFGGRPPIELVVSGTLDALLTVRRFLDAACLGEYISANEVDVGFRGYRDVDIVLV
jgi:hypothetical protein